MGKGTNKEDYKASPAELENARVAQSEYQKFKTSYAPLLKKRAIDTQTDDIKTTLRGRANADAMQTLTKTSLPAAEAPATAGIVAEGLTGQLGEANEVARTYQNDMGADTLAKGRRQVGYAQEGLAHVSRLGTSAALARAQAKDAVAQAKWNAVADIGSAYVGQGMENISETPGSWHAPSALIGADDNGKPIYRKSDSLRESFQIGTGRNFRR
jgi:hypothetical protein